MRAFLQCDCASSLASFVIWASQSIIPPTEIEVILMRYCACALLLPSQSVFLGGRPFRRTVFEARAGGQAISLPVASVLAVVAATLGAGVHPHRLSCLNHLAAWRIDVAVRTWRTTIEVRWASPVDSTMHSQKSTFENNHFSSSWPYKCFRCFSASQEIRKILAESA